MILSAYIIPLTKPVTTIACISNNSTSQTTPIKQPKIANFKQTSRKSSNQLSVEEVERAIGAGVYRDYDSDSETKEKKNVFDVVLSKSIGRTEGPTERKLRETGEWMNAEGERATRSAGKKILEIMMLWIAPAWLLLFLVAVGAIKLPSNFTALNDFIM